MDSKDYPWLTSLLSYFKTIKQYDSEIESFRSSLCSLPDFSPVSLFSYLDKNLKSFLTLNDFKLFLSSENFNFDEIKLRKLIHNFDKDGDFSLNLHEFSYLIQSKRKKIKNEFYPNYNKIELSEEIKSDFKNILEKEMDLIKELNDISKEMINSKIFSTYEAFTVIVGKDKYITKNNLGKFLNDNFMEISEEDVEQIMFRIDADNDDKISYEEFKEIFFPFKDDLELNNNYNIKNNINNDIANKYLNIDIENDNDNYEKKEEQNFVNKEENNNINKEENNKIIDEKDEINSGEKKKTTKKVILKPKLNNNINSDSDMNLLYSKNSLIKKEEPIEKIFENKYIGKCKNCGVPKKETIITNKYSIEPENKKLVNNYKEEKTYTLNINDNIKVNNNNSKNTLSSSNKEYNHVHKSSNCKACLYTAKNIFNDLREKNNSNSPFSSSDKFNFNKIEENKEEDKIILKNENKNIFENNYEENKVEKNDEENLEDIYKNKDELLKKYGISSENDYNRKQEKDDDFSNFDFSTQKKTYFIKEINDENNNINKIDKSPLELENINTVFKSKNNITTNNSIIETNNISDTLSNLQRNNIIPKNDINEKKTLLFKLFISFIEKENSIQKIKQKLSSCQDANSQSLFKLFNKNNSNIITSSAMIETLNSFSPDSFSINDIKYIFKKYNKTTSNGFTFEEFKNILFNNEALINDDEINLEENTKNIIVELFKEIIEGEKEIENSKVLLDKTAQNIYYDLFEEIKQKEKLGIEKEDIDKFMKENECDIKEEEVCIIMEKMDKNKDRLIDYSEFIDEIRPMNFC